MPISRKAFLIQAASGGWLLATAGCGGGGGDSGSSRNPPAPPAGSGCAATISDNHGHVLAIAAADLDSTSDKTYDIQGSAGHTHSVTFTAAQLAQLKAGNTVSVTSSDDARPRPPDRRALRLIRIRYRSHRFGDARGCARARLGAGRCGAADATPAARVRCGAALGSHRVTRCAHCVRCARTDAVSKLTKRVGTRAERIAAFSPSHTQPAPAGPKPCKRRTFLGRGERQDAGIEPAVCRRAEGALSTRAGLDARFVCFSQKNSWCLAQSRGRVCGGVPVRRRGAQRFGRRVYSRARRQIRHVGSCARARQRVRCERARVARLWRRPPQWRAAAHPPTALRSSVMRRALSSMRSNGNRLNVSAQLSSIP